VATWIAFLRGINVGGNGSLPMKELVSLLADNGCKNVRTYIQSGNAVFEATKAQATRLPKDIGAAVLKKRGFEPRMLVLSLAELEAAASANPYPKATAEPKFLHVFFLSEKPAAPDIEAMNRVKAAHEHFTLSGKHFYLHTPKGFGTSKLAARTERLLGVDATARNWRTVTAMLEMARPAKP
jgi:uncharacterized protein (DUF1697 family)